MLSAPGHAWKQKKRGLLCTMWIPLYPGCSLAPGRHKSLSHSPGSISLWPWPPESQLISCGPVVKEHRQNTRACATLAVMEIPKGTPKDWLGFPSSHCGNPKGREWDHLQDCLGFPTSSCSQWCPNPPFSAAQAFRGTQALTIRLRAATAALDPLYGSI